MSDPGRARRAYLAIAAFAAVYGLIIWGTANPYYQLMLALVPIWAVLGLSWNIFSGYSGQISFGHAAFFGIGAYTTTLLFVLLEVPPWFGIPASAVVGALAGLLIGAITFRLRGHYFALAMLAYPLAMLPVMEWAGFQEVSFPMKRDQPLLYMQFQDQRWSALLALALMTAAMLVSVGIERSRFGLSLLAVKQNEFAAEAAGIDSMRWKMKAIALSGAFAGAAGGFYAVVLLVVTPSTVFGMPVSAQALIVTMFGGVATVWGPVLGAVVLVPLAETLHAELGSYLPGVQGVVFGIAIIVVMLLMPQGVIWAVRSRLERPASRLPKPEAERSSEAPAFLMPPRAPVVLEIDGLSRSFGGVRALNDVNIRVRRHEILGIIGPNGAGKTTLFNVLNGLIPPDRGSVRFNDADITGLRPSEICRQGIGRTFQVVRSFPRMTLLENVVVGAFVREAEDTAARARAREVIERVGLSHAAECQAGALTNLELRLMEIARALASGPSILLMDEPFAGLSAGEIERLLMLVRGLRAGGVTIVIIEHTMHAMLKLVDRFVVLDHGEIIAEGDPQAVVRDARVVKAYLGDGWVTDAVA